MAHDDPKHPHPHPDRDALTSSPSGHDHDHDHGHAHPHPHDHGGHGHGHGHAHPHPHDHAGGVGGHAHGSEAGASRAVLARGAGAGRILHLDCFAGLAGDMIVGALLDLGVPREPLQAALETLPLEGFGVGAVETSAHAIAATRFVVRVEGAQPQRTYRDIRSMLDAAALPDGVRRRAQDAFHALAVAEGRVHRIAPEDVHFHEVGAVDAIVDIVAASAALDWLGARVTCAPLPMGRGFTRAAHGVLPLPPPAVVELLAGVPTLDAGLDAELVTPTGAALVRANATEFPRWPAMRPVATGFGAGTRTLPDRPNLLRVVLGEPDAAAAPGGREAFVTLECNLDDATGELLAHTASALLEAGALDAWTSAIGMKKSRPGLMLCALARAADAERLARVMLAESTTLGVRLRPCERLERPRHMVSVETPYGAVPVKVAEGDGLPVSAKPEDDAVRALARARSVPARTVHAAALAAFWAARGSTEG